VLTKHSTRVVLVAKISFPSGFNVRGLIFYLQCHQFHKACDHFGRTQYSQFLQFVSSSRGLPCRVECETLADMLSDLDHKVVTADCGRDALAKLGSDDFDLVFTDLAMPEMDGWETAREIRKSRPDLPIVLVTGYGATAQPPSGSLISWLASSASHSILLK